MNTKRKQLLHCFLGITALVWSGCVMFVSPYDEVTDKAISDLSTQTEQFFAKSASKISYSDTNSFVTQAKGSLQAIRLRSELYGDKNKGEISDIDKLQQNFDLLLSLTKTPPVSATEWNVAHAEIQSNFRSLMQIELAKKHSGVSEAKTSS